jgi:hypothetical protein
MFMMLSPAISKSFCCAVCPRAPYTYTPSDVSYTSVVLASNSSHPTGRVRLRRGIIAGVLRASGDRSVGACRDWRQTRRHVSASRRGTPRRKVCDSLWNSRDVRPGSAIQSSCLACSARGDQRTCGVMIVFHKAYPAPFKCNASARKSSARGCPSGSSIGVNTSMN